MVGSRCGLSCAECTYRASVGCKGCVQIQQPFWGESCPIKTCCEGRELAHCGLCGEFPCKLLEQFAYDKEQGDGGARIERCRRWAENAQ